MIDHVSIRSKEIERSRQFYEAALKPLGIASVMEVKPDQSGGYHGIGYGMSAKPFFWLSADSRVAEADIPRATGIHIAFSAASRAAVDAFHAAALTQGGATTARRASGRITTLIIMRPS